ncbi:MAG: serine hydrolase domain-containing protein, partial [Pseudomonadota bacterium]|nr:serine hydrolase domain-containing protein [Pseudomonadota bacterium]
MTTEIDGVSVQGNFDERFAPTMSQFAGHIATGQDVGASFALSVDGEMVVDVWAGSQDEAGEIPWKEDTIINVYSSTKTISFLCALVAADRGLIDFDAPVGNYWPEFIANGKEGVLVWHLMNHAAGLPGLDRPVSLEEMCDR